MSIKHLNDIRADDVGAVGGKAASLGELSFVGHPVPVGFVVLAGQPIFDEEILRAYDELGLGNVAVRSSGIGEDGQDQSWAGQFATTLHVTRDGLLDAVQACIDSADAARVQAYASGAFDLAVLVQQMVHSQVAGVAFSANPVTGDREQVMIEAVYGLGELLVQGTVTPDHWLLAKNGGIIEEDIATKTSFLTYHGGQTIEAAVLRALQNEPCLTHAQLREITTMVNNIEDYYGYPVDVEWAYDESGVLYLLQARPITTI